MIPLDILDSYMIVISSACVLYVLFMVLLLFCFLRNFKSTEEDRERLHCDYPIELTSVSNVYQPCSVDQGETVSCPPSTAALKVYRISKPLTKIDISQMERLAS